MYPNYEKPFTFDRVVRIIIGMLILVGIYGLLYKLRSALVPFFIAWLVAYLLNPLVSFFQHKWKVKSRMLSILLSLIMVTIVLGLSVYALWGPVENEFSRLGELLQKAAENSFDTWYVPDGWQHQLQQFAGTNDISKIISREQIVELLKKVLPQFWSIFSGGFNFLLSLTVVFVVLLYIVFILLDFDVISNGWKKMIPEKYRSILTQISEDIEESMQRYFRGQAMIALIVGILCAIGFAIIGLPLGIVIGLFIGLLNMIPYLKIVGFIPTTLMAIIKSAETGQNFWSVMLAIVIVFAIIQTFEDMYLVPKIMGKKMGMNPAVILLSLSIWGSLLGFMGLIIALPITTLFISYYRRFILDEQVEMIVENEAIKIKEQIDDEKL